MDPDLLEILRSLGLPQANAQADVTADIGRRSRESFTEPLSLELLRETPLGMLAETAAGFTPVGVATDLIGAASSASVGDNVGAVAGILAAVPGVPVSGAVIKKGLGKLRDMLRPVGDFISRGIGGPGGTIGRAIHRVEIDLPSVVDADFDEMMGLVLNDRAAGIRQIRLGRSMADDVAFGGAANKTVPFEARDLQDINEQGILDAMPSKIRREGVIQRSDREFNIRMNSQRRLSEMEDVISRGKAQRKALKESSTDRNIAHTRRMGEVSPFLNLPGHGTSTVSGFKDVRFGLPTGTELSDIPFGTKKLAPRPEGHLPESLQALLKQFGRN